MIPRGDRIRLAVVAHDALFFGLSLFVGTLAIQGTAPFASLGLQALARDAVIFACVGAVLLHILGLNRAIWRYASIGELRAIVTGAVLMFAITVTLGGFILSAPTVDPRAAAFSCLLAGMTISGTRFLYRLHRNRRARGRLAQTTIPRAVFYGTTDEAEALVRRQSELGNALVEIAAIYNPRVERVRAAVRTIPVAASLDRLWQIVEAERVAGRPIRELFLSRARPQLAPNQLRRLLTGAAEHGMRLSQRRQAPGRKDQAASFVMAPASVAMTDLAVQPELAASDGDTMLHVSRRKIAIVGLEMGIARAVVSEAARRGPASMVLAGDDEAALAVAARRARAALPASSVHLTIGLGAFSHGLRARLAETSPHTVILTQLTSNPFVPWRGDEQLFATVFGTFAETLDTILAAKPERVIVAIDRQHWDTRSTVERALRFAELLGVAAGRAAGVAVLPVRIGVPVDDIDAKLSASSAEARAGLRARYAETMVPIMSTPDAALMLLRAASWLDVGRPSEAAVLGTNGSLGATANDLADWLGVLRGDADATPDRLDAQARVNAVPGAGTLLGPLTTPLPLFAPREEPSGTRLPGLVAGTLAGARYDGVADQLTALRGLLAAGDVAAVRERLLDVTSMPELAT